MTFSRFISKKPETLVAYHTITNGEKFVEKFDETGASRKNPTEGQTGSLIVHDGILIYNGQKCAVIKLALMQD
mgnify:CR=1 FL=1